jgi:hypothetical protein
MEMKTLKDIQLEKAVLKCETLRALLQAVIDEPGISEVFKKPLAEALATIEKE